MITRDTIDKIFSTARVEEVISDFVNLKKAGSNYKGLSPFVDEKSPSFMVSPSKQIWKDFSSGKGGTAISFLMELEQFSYPEALKYLANKYNIEVEETQENLSEDYKKEKEAKELLYQIHDIAKEYFNSQLLETEEGKSIGLSYFKERGFTDETIETFSLGYSPKLATSFAEFASKKGYKKEILEASGICYFKEERGIDRFRERVIFPIFSYSGRTLGFGGRILKTNAKAAKYLNSPETEIYHKSKILYGLFQAKKYIVKEDLCYLVEGYTDVISLYQKGIRNVVASSGTALTPDQIKLIKRLTPNIVILFDGDAAGIKASLRSIDLILEQELNVKILLFPDGKDPDGFAKENSIEYIKEFLDKNAKDFIHFKTELLLDDVKDDPVKKAALIRDIIKTIALIPNRIQRELYVQSCATILKVSEKVLFKDLEQILQQKSRNQRKEEAKITEESIVRVANEKISINPLDITEQKLIEIMLKYGDSVLTYLEEEEEIEITVIEQIIHELEEDEINFQSVFLNKIYEEIKDGFKNKDLRTGSFFVKLLDPEISENWLKKDIFVRPKEKDIKKEMEQTILSYKLLNIKLLVDTIAKKMKDTQEESEEQRQQNIQQIMKLRTAEIELKKILNRVI